MLKTKPQKLIFSILMALIMVYGMETYNHFLLGLRGLNALRLPLIELLGLMAAVILLQEAVGGRVARFIAFHIVNPQSAPKLKVILTVQVFTVFIMCPLMSAVASFVFKRSEPLPFVQIWANTLLANLPFAMLWQLLIAGPLVRKIVSYVKA